jgi:hypothetical protein
MMLRRVRPFDLRIELRFMCPHHEAGTLVFEAVPLSGRIISFTPLKQTRRGAHMHRRFWVNLTKAPELCPRPH